jgi:hypothetical protein
MEKKFHYKAHHLVLGEGGRLLREMKREMVYWPPSLSSSSAGRGWTLL